MDLPHITGNGMTLPGELGDEAYAGVVKSERRRVLVANDDGSHGLMWVLSVAELKAPAPQGSWKPYSEPSPSPRPWSDLLSTPLLDDLDEWNDLGNDLQGATSSADGWDAFWFRAAGLARRVQLELGAGYEVLYQSTYMAWCWVLPPWESSR